MDSQAPSAESTSGESGLREELVQACQVLYAVKAAGDGLGGHLSARLDGQRILIKPRPVSWRKLKPEDLIVIDFEGKRVDGPADGSLDGRSAIREWPIHARIYAARPDVRCVLHAHPRASTLMAALGIAVEPLDQDCASFAGRPLSAVVQAKDGKYGVFVVSNSSAGEVARLHSVDIGAVNGSEITVVSGLQTGERIITTGANLLKDGQPVEVLQ